MSSSRRGVSRRLIVVPLTASLLIVVLVAGGSGNAQDTSCQEVRQVLEDLTGVDEPAGAAGQSLEQHERYIAALTAKVSGEFPGCFPGVTDAVPVP